MKYKKWDIEKVRQFIDDNSNCALLSNEYINMDTKMQFKCECGTHFETTFYRFKSRNKRQCNSCGYKKLSEHQRLPYDEVKHFIEIESESGCKLLSKEYKSAYQKLKIQCKCGDIYYVPWRHFKNGNQRQCPKCGIEIRASAKRLPIEEVIATIEEKGCTLLSEYETVGDKIKIKCPCGNIFHTSYGIFRDYEVDKCASCRRKGTVTSKGEDKIRKWLNNNDIDYIEEYTFKDLKNSNKLRFDFAVLNNKGQVKLLIEYDGKQHFGLGNFSDNTDEMICAYQRVLMSDEKKNEYCFKNSIPLLRISYNKYPKIKEILERVL